MGHADDAAAALQAATDAMTVDAGPALLGAREAVQRAQAAITEAQQAVRDTLGYLASAGDSYVGGELGATTTGFDEDLAQVLAVSAQLEQACTDAMPVAATLADRYRDEAARLMAGA